MAPTHECKLCAQPAAWQLPLCPSCDADLVANPKVVQFDGLTVVALYPYGYPVDQVLLQFKAGQLQWQTLLDYCLHKALAAMQRSDDAALLAFANYLQLPAVAVAAVPLAHKRLAERGYNQSQLLASMLHKPMAVGLRRVVDTPHQQGLSRSERLQNVQGAFAVTGALPRQLLLIDDVLTTGATLRALAQTIRQHQAHSQVRALSFCYAEL